MRNKAERKILQGFVCYDCEDYYASKSQEGLSEEKIKQVINTCSKHRSKFKRSSTPPRFWDPEMIEGDLDSPRNKTQMQTEPLSTLARRRASRKEAKNSIKCNILLKKHL